jgi:hypothetical protein
MLVNPLAICLAGLDPMRHAVLGLWPDAQGNVYLAGTGAGSVKKVSHADGQVTVVYRSSPPFAPTGVTVAGDTLLVLESALSSARVVRVPTSAGRN